jgi:hypothetical protein
VALGARGLFLSLAGMGVFLLALRENRFFSAVVRFQREAVHAVCSTGVPGGRHPGNAGMILGTLGSRCSALGLERDPPCSPSP